MGAQLPRGGSSVGRASRSQCEGRGFDSLPLHSKRTLASQRLARVFCVSSGGICPPSPLIRKAPSCYLEPDAMPPNDLYFNLGSVLSDGTPRRGNRPIPLRGDRSMRSQLHKSALPSWHRAEDQFKITWHQAEQWLKRRAGESLQCRECRNRVRLLEYVCPHCGAVSPARIPLSLGALAVAAALACLALAAWLM